MNVRLAVMALWRLVARVSVVKPDSKPSPRPLVGASLWKLAHSALEADVLPAGNQQADQD